MSNRADDRKQITNQDENESPILLSRLFDSEKSEVLSKVRDLYNNYKLEQYEYKDPSRGYVSGVFLKEYLFQLTILKPEQIIINIFVEMLKKRHKDSIITYEIKRDAATFKLDKTGKILNTIDEAVIFIELKGKDLIDYNITNLKRKLTEYDSTLEIVKKPLIHNK